MPDPTPAPRWISTVWPLRLSCSTPAGVMATRYSSGLISFGTPMIIRLLLSLGLMVDETAGCAPALNGSRPSSAGFAHVARPSSAAWPKTGEGKVYFRLWQANDVAGHGLARIGDHVVQRLGAHAARE